jgi:DMSO/TMAO reductase YedYZ heme-binding membrane subunit
MALTRTGYILSGAVLLLFAVVNALALSTPSDSPLGLAVRLFALNGYLALAVATTMTPFLLKVARAFGRPFLKVHHFVSAFAIALTTLHPVALAIMRANPLVFIPNITSPLAINLGRVALILLSIALVGSLLRTRVKQWRYLHVLMYLVLFIGIIHANYLGTDMELDAIRAIYNLLGVAVGISLGMNISLKVSRMKSRSRAPAP